MFWQCGLDYLNKGRFCFAGKAGLDMTHTEGRRNIVQHFADGLADADEVGTTTDRA
ncbi:hypothetical protein IE4803_PB00345 (plasmid) [Rhizobium etli bv. phaseoli str. IE4803]|nr:hypothetical protein IE4803_PB00345 [Rhizobium etli bv. phaseoli str. IE4803]ARQ60786.1 hypothetical protein Kim5_PA00318 [Rhizobium sp. Kim5]